MKPQVVKLECYINYDSSLEAFIYEVDEVIRILNANVIEACQWIDERSYPKIIKSIVEDWVNIKLGGKEYVFSKTKHNFIGYTLIKYNDDYAAYIRVRL